jgi:hypothetical protein
MASQAELLIFLICLAVFCIAFRLYQKSQKDNPADDQLSGHQMLQAIVFYLSLSVIIYLIGWLWLEPNAFIASLNRDFKLWMGGFAGLLILPAVSDESYKGYRFVVCVVTAIIAYVLITQSY